LTGSGSDGFPLKACGNDGGGEKFDFKSTGWESRIFERTFKIDINSSKKEKRIRYENHEKSFAS
jgi:hypothetical protein